MIKCKIYEGQIDDAEQQVEFVKQVEDTMGRSSEMAFLEGKISARKEIDEDDPKAQEQRIIRSIQLIDESLKKHIKFTKTLKPGFNFFINLNPDFLLELAKEYFQFSEIEFEETNNEKPVPLYIKNGNKLLITILKQIPGLTTAYLLLAKGKVL